MEKEIDELMGRVERRIEEYRKYLKKGDKIRKRERDTFFTEKDKTVLIESFVIGGVLENLITKTINRIL
ncbi:MAG: hypothetical protein ACK4SM_03270 [Aquificaceae bacterium]